MSRAEIHGHSDNSVNPVNVEPVSQEKQENGLQMPYFLKGVNQLLKSVFDRMTILYPGDFLIGFPDKQKYGNGKHSPPETHH